MGGADCSNYSKSRREGAWGGGQFFLVFFTFHIISRQKFLRNFFLRSPPVMQISTDAFELLLSSEPFGAKNRGSRAEKFQSQTGRAGTVSNGSVLNGSRSESLSEPNRKTVRL